MFSLLWKATKRIAVERAPRTPLSGFPWKFPKIAIALSTLFVTCIVTLCIPRDDILAIAVISLSGLTKCDSILCLSWEATSVFYASVFHGGVISMRPELPCPKDISHTQVFVRNI